MSDTIRKAGVPQASEEGSWAESGTGSGRRLGLSWGVVGTYKTARGRGAGWSEQKDRLWRQGLAVAGRSGTGGCKPVKGLGLHSECAQWLLQTFKP